MAIAAADKVVHGNDLTYITQQYKNYFQAKESGKGLSTNDYTTEEKTKLAGIDAGADVNVIETVKFNGTALTPDANKAVDVEALPISGGTVTGPITVAEVSGNIVSAQTVVYHDRVVVANALAGSAARTIAVYAGKIDATVAIPNTSTTGTYSFTFPAASGVLALRSQIPAALSELSDDVGYLTSSDLSTYAPLVSPALTGTPTAPTASAGTNTTQVATTEFVTTAVNNAIGSVTGLSFNTDYSTYAAMAATTGSAGVIYLIPNSGTSPNSYDEYFWNGSGYEKFGTTDVDLSGYVQTSALETLTTSEINTLLNL